MIILDFLDVLELLVDEQRDIVINALLNELSVYSHYAILEAQLNWDASNSYEEFIKYQNQVIIECVKIEMSLFGKKLRIQYGLEPLTLRSEIKL